MFHCKVTGKRSESGEKLHKLVVAKRSRAYVAKVENEETGYFEDLVVGHGWEIVREVNSSQEGLDLFFSLDEEQKRDFLKRL